MQFILGDKREVHLLDESALPVTEKERRGEGKRNISPRMKYGHANHKRLNTLHLPFVYGQNDLRFACPYFILGPMFFFPSLLFSFSVAGRALSSTRRTNLSLVLQNELHAL